MFLLRISTTAATPSCPREKQLSKCFGGETQLSLSPHQKNVRNQLSSMVAMLRVGKINNEINNIKYTKKKLGYEFHFTQHLKQEILNSLQFFFMKDLPLETLPSTKIWMAQSRPSIIKIHFLIMNYCKHQLREQSSHTQAGCWRNSTSAFHALQYQLCNTL